MECQGCRHLTESLLGSRGRGFRPGEPRPPEESLLEVVNTSASPNRIAVVFHELKASTLFVQDSHTILGCLTVATRKRGRDFRADQSIYHLSCSRQHWIAMVRPQQPANPEGP